MRTTRGLLFVLAWCLLAGACGKEDDPGFTSMIGSWQYTTPDEKIKVTFDLVGGTTEVFSVKNQTITVDGQEGRAEVQADNLSETGIGSIRINANDAALTFPYNIMFNDLSPNEDFTVIKVKDATYVFPWQNNNSLTDIEIVRR